MAKRKRESVYTIESPDGRESYIVTTSDTLAKELALAMDGLAGLVRFAKPPTRAEVTAKAQTYSVRAVKPLPKTDK